MTATINRILALLSPYGPLPNATRYRQYLEGLETRKLQARLADLEASEEKHVGRTWSCARRSAKEVYGHA